MAEIPSHQGAKRPALAAALLDRRAVFWTLAAVYLALFVFNDYRGFLGLGDLSGLDADDGLRLQEVRDLVAGQSWFDLHQYRYLPPAGTLMHWSRLVDAPIAAMIALLTPLVGSPPAERIAVAAWPVLLLLVYLALIARGLSRAFSQGAAAFAVVVALNLLAFRDLFGAGAIDHHNVQVVLLLASVLAFASASSRPMTAIAGGIAAALSLAIGLESLPYVAGVGALYVLAWAIDPSQTRALNLFAASFALASCAAFAVETSPTLWFAPACDALSTPWLLLAGGAWAAAAVLTGLGGVVVGTPRTRLAAAALAGAVLAGLFVALFPVCLAGPYHAVPAALRPAWLELTGEALSLQTMLADYPSKAAIVFGPTFAAMLAAWIGARHSEGEARRLLLATASLLTLTLALCLFEIRAIYVGVALTPVAAGWALERIFAKVTAPGRASPKLALAMAAMLFFELPWLSAAFLAERLGVHPAVESHDSEKMRACLRDVPQLASVPKGVILGPIDLGAHILFLTDQAIVAAGYHRNIEGIDAGLTAFSGDESDLKAVAMRDHADYVALCLPWIEAHPERYGVFAQALASGAANAAWLVRVPLKSSALRLWRVRPIALASVRR